MSVKRIFFHFGITKTGSTSIQKTLFTNSAILERNSFRYLNEWKISHRPVFKLLFKQRPSANFFINKIRQYYKNSYCKSLLNVIDTTDCETLVLSGEYWTDFHLDSTIQNLRLFIEEHFQNRGIETKIILFVRNPLTWMISHLQSRMSSGDYDRNSDFAETRIEHFPGIWNLKKNFPDSLILVKFEDAIKDDYGPVGYFLNTIGFPKDTIPEIDIIKANESRCLEAMEFINYIEDKEPVFPNGYGKPININRELFSRDLAPVFGVKGLKFDLEYKEKLLLWEQLKETVLHIKTNTGIDYTNYKIPASSELQTYSEETIQGFIGVFPSLSPVIQKHFLRFFETKYSKTLNPAFKSLYFKNSIPKTIYNKHNAASFFLWYVKKFFYGIKDFIRTMAKHILGRRVIVKKNHI